MSTFVVHNNVLYADRLMTIILPRMGRMEGQKLCVSKDNQFAYCITGTTVSSDKQPLYDALLRKFLNRVVVKHILPKDPLEKYIDMGEWKQLIDSMWGFLICTNKRQFGSLKSGSNSIVFETTGHPCAVGSSSQYLNGIMAAGVEPEKAYPLVYELDSSTGPVVDKLDLSTLDDYVIQGKE